MSYEDLEKGEWGLYIWDKSSIGSLNGKAYKQEKVVYGKGETNKPDDVSEITYTDEYVAKYEDWPEKTEERLSAKGNALKGELTFSNDLITATSSFLEEEFPGRNGKPASLEASLSVRVKGYYRKGDDVYVRIAQVSTINIQATVKIQPPEDSEGFIGASASHAMTYTARYTSEDGSDEITKSESGTHPGLLTRAGRVK